MVRAAIFGAEQVVSAGFGRLEPDSGVSILPGYDIGLDAECGDKKAVDYVFARHNHLDATANGHVQFIDLALSVCVLEPPHPLLGGDVNIERIARIAIDLEIELRTPDEDDHDDERGNNSPGNF